MGGDNQSTLPKDKPVEQSPEILRMDRVVEEKKKGKEKSSKKDKDKKKKSKSDDTPTQLQNLRQHVSGTECHWHDDENGLKAAIPVADWFNIKKSLNRLKREQYVDASNATVITFCPFVTEDGEVDCVTTLESVAVSKRFDQLVNLK